GRPAPLPARPPAPARRGPPRTAGTRRLPRRTAGATLTRASTGAAHHLEPKATAQEGPDDTPPHDTGHIPSRRTAPGSRLPRRRSPATRDRLVPRQRAAAAVARSRGVRLVDPRLRGHESAD